MMASLKFFQFLPMVSGAVLQRSLHSLAYRRAYLIVSSSLSEARPERSSRSSKKIARSVAVPSKVGAEWCQRDGITNGVAMFNDCTGEGCCKGL